MSSCGSISSSSSSSSPALSCEVVARSGKKARCLHVRLPHFEVHTPLFMPVGTQGTVKALTPEQLEELGAQIVLGNTYHLGHRPGSEVVAQLGGLHSFMSWKRGILTDSGGFQMVSLLALAEITEEGVRFQSPHDGSEMMLRPEDSMAIQNRLGADIMMALDDVVSSVTTGPRVEEATHRTLRWIDRCIQAHARPLEQNLFGIVQGGLDPDLRRYCAEELVKRDLPGYAIGGLSGGESKDDFWKMVSLSTDVLPWNKPRYCMGVGYPLDLVVCVALGADMFDCVFPTRTARFGSALIPEGQIDLKNPKYATDSTPLCDEFDWYVAKYPRSYLHRLMVEREETGCALLSYHNIAYMMKLGESMRAAIQEDEYDRFCQRFVARMFPLGDIPQWTIDALASVEIDISWESLLRLRLVDPKASGTSTASSSEKNTVST